MTTRFLFVVAVVLGSADGGTCPEDMVAVPGTATCIDRYEASKDKSGRARSAKGVMPAAKVTWDEARSACEAAGKRLCSEQEWLAACQGPEKRKYPYGDEFKSKVCNDWDASDRGRKGARPTGSFPRCVTAEGVFDLQGNVAEWISDAKKMSPDLVEVRGGTYNMTIGEDSWCRGDDYPVKKTEQRPDVGFRCCRSL